MAQRGAQRPEQHPLPAPGRERFAAPADWMERRREAGEAAAGARLSAGVAAGCLPSLGRSSAPVRPGQGAAEAWHGEGLATLWAAEGRPKGSLQRAAPLFTLGMGQMRV